MEQETFESLNLASNHCKSAVGKIQIRWDLYTALTTTSCRWQRNIVIVSCLNLFCLARCSNVCLSDSMYILEGVHLYL